MGLSQSARTAIEGVAASRDWPAEKGSAIRRAGQAVTFEGGKGGWSLVSGGWSASKGTSVHFGFVFQFMLGASRKAVNWNLSFRNVIAAIVSS